ncbi:sulfatase [Paenibacillus alkaliterrae]|uniref:sulfatase n=1 Tax=Paenibacillus alkaliterrae TaxID=320909 RepID=UPI001F25CD40|nr:sulfatase [Paenibacillus alkaliterrae]MCF2941819.1 sulfatase [Paenibacillus alkaliterrae]
MKAIMLMFDSLNKHMLPNYGCDWVQAPNFKRLEERIVTFDNCYAGSLPCVPARRELHTGRYNFMHRSWGPLEPFDNSMIELMKKNNVYTHLTTDHSHYFEDGGATYHTRYHFWEFARGQEGDAWKGQVGDPAIPESLSSPKLGGLWRQYWINRQYLNVEENMPLAVTVRRGIEFIERNYEQDQWFLQIEAFDPHEPFFTQQQYKDLYPHFYDGKHFDWPDYGKVTQQPEEIQHMIFEYAALISMCDTYLGKILEAFDRFNLWKDTMLIVNTDHGFFLAPI